MKAGFIQFKPSFCNVNATIDELKNLFESDKCDNADLIVLPELANSGYNFTDKKQALDNAETVQDSKFLNFLISVAKEKNCYIATGFNEKENDLLYNSAVLLGPDGLIGKYRKIHLFLNEKDIFEPGNYKPEVFSTPVGKIGLLVCFDWFFPEVWRILALKGADIICHVSNLVLPGFAQKAIPIHALTNHVFVITANRIGTEKELTFTGMSTIADPKGNVLYQSGSKEVDIKTVDFNLKLARDKNITPRNNMFKDRRVEMYSEILKNDF